MSDHTKEPWKCDSPKGCDFVVSDYGTVIATCFGEIGNDHVRFENASRIVACVNACAGIVHPEKIPEMIAKAKQLLQVIIDKAGLPVYDDDMTELDFAANELADLIAILEDQK